MAPLARLQRRLLRAGGVRLSMPSVVVIVYASNAISVSIPIAGAPMSAAFSFRSFARRGADRSLAGWVLTISGVISTIAFVLIVAVGALLSGNTVAAVVGTLGALATALVAAGVHAPEAVAAVLVYRLISFWLVDAVGWMLYVTTRKRGRLEPLASDSVDLSP